MTYATILFAETQGAYRLTLNRPDRLNAFTSEMHAEVADAVRVVANDPRARVLLITGAGRAFCAGQDLDQRDVASTKALDLGEAVDTWYNPLVRQLAALSAPVVCAVNGVAAGAGVNLALACDIVLARKSARFVQAFSAIGLVPDAGGSWHLPRLVGQARALGISLLGESLSAERAENLGLIWRAIDDAAFETEVDATVAKLAAGPTFGLGATKQLIRGALTRDLAPHLDLERDAQRACGLAADYREGVLSFREKRAPRFDGVGPGPFGAAGR